MGQGDLPVMDRNSCIGCGVCVAVCPDRILQRDAAGLPAIVGDRCMLCGHCVAACPVEAVTIPALADTLGVVTFAEHGPSTGTATVAPVEILQLMRRRRSCRCFTAAPVELNLLTDLTKIGSTAPSGTNSQGWKFIILPQRSDVERLGEATADFYQRLNNKAANPFYRLLGRLFAGDALASYYQRYYPTIRDALTQWRQERIDRLFHGAPAVIIVAADEHSSCPAEDALLATQNILLAAQSLGLGTCMIGFVVEAARRDKRIASLLRLGKDERIYSVIACGHPAVCFQRPAPRKPVRPRIIRIGREKPCTMSKQAGQQGGEVNG